MKEKQVELQLGKLALYEMKFNGKEKLENLKNKAENLI